MKRDLDFVVAMTEKRVIGRDNQLPWHIPADLKHFKNLTQGHTVIMGRRTFDSVGKALPRRKNIVLTRDKNFHAPDVTVCHDWSQVDRAVEGHAFVIGGGEIFALATPRLRRLYLTVIHEDIPGDAYFPALPLQQDFELESQSEMFTDPVRFQFQTWKHREA